LRCGRLVPVICRPLRSLCAIQSLLLVAFGAATVHAQPGESHERATTPAAPSPAPEIAAPQPDWVTVTLRTDDLRASLYVEEPGRLVVVGSEPSEAWAFVCKAPCGRKVDPRKVYRVMGDKLEPSKEFDLAPGSGAVSLDVDPHLRSTRTVGTVVAYTGLASLAMGAVVLLAGVIEADAVDSVQGALPTANFQTSAGTYEEIGVTMMVTGVVMEIAAAAIFMTRTTGLKPSASASATGLRPIPWGVAF
jgi:hypothetical protein